MIPEQQEQEPQDLKPGQLWKPGLYFSEREIHLIRNVQCYARSNPSGLPGHNLMMIIDRLVAYIKLREM